MARITYPITNFTAGEISPDFSGQSSSSLYRKGCREMTNFLPRSQGGFAKRTGSAYVGHTKDNAKNRLIPFSPTSEKNFLLSLTDQCLTFYEDGLEAGEIFVPFEEGELETLQFAQGGRALYFAHPNHAPWVLSWSEGDGFTYGYPSIVTNETQIDSDDPETVPFSSEGNYPGCVAFLYGRLWFARTNLERQTLWATAVSGFSAEELDFTYYQTISYVTEETRYPVYHDDGTVMRYGGDHDDDPEDPEDETLWDTEIYPGGEPVWQSADYVPDLESAESPLAHRYRTSTDRIGASDAIKITLGGQRSEEIVSLVPRSHLMVFTTTSEWAVNGQTTALVQSAEIFSAFGSAPYQFSMAADALIFIQEDKKTVREYYASGSGAWSSLSLTFPSDHMTESGIRTYVSQSAPEPVVFFVLENGDMARLLYDKNQGALGWSRITAGGGGAYESAAMLNQTLYVTVERDGVRTIEAFGSDRALTEGEASYVDSYLTLETEDGALSGLERFEGDEIYALSESGEAFGPYTVAEGVLNTGEAGTFRVGYAYGAAMETLDAETSDLMGRTKRLISVVCRLLRTRHISAGGACLESGDFQDEDEWVTGDFEISAWENSGPASYVRIESPLPLPCHVTALLARMEIN